MLQSNQSSDLHFMVVYLVNDESAKCLRIHIDTELTFHSHITHVVKKLSKQLSVIAQLRHYVPRGTLLKYYQIYIKQIITNGLLVYGCTSGHQLNPIYIIQKKVLRIILFKPQFQASREMFFQNGFLKVFELYAMELLKFCPKSARRKLLIFSSQLL